MKKVTIFILSMMVVTTHAYNPEATKKLQEMVKGITDTDEVVSRVKEIEQLIKDGADPNAQVSFSWSRMGDIDLIDAIIMTWNRKKDLIALENLIKLMLEKGLKIPIDFENRGVLDFMIEMELTNVVKMVINSGPNKQQIEKNADNAIKIINDLIKQKEHSIKMYQEETQKRVEDIQERILGHKKLIDDLKKPSTKNAMPSAFEGGDAGVQKANRPK